MTREELIELVIEAATESPADVWAKQQLRKEKIRDVVGTARVGGRVTRAGIKHGPAGMAARLGAWARRKSQ